MNGVRVGTSTSSVTSSSGLARSMKAWRLERKTRKRWSSRMSIDAGWTQRSSKGSRPMRPWAMAARISRSERTTASEYGRRRGLAAAATRDRGTVELRARAVALPDLAAGGLAPFEGREALLATVADAPAADRVAVLRFARVDDPGVGVGTGRTVHETQDMGACPLNLGNYPLDGGTAVWYTSAMSKVDRANPRRSVASEARFTLFEFDREFPDDAACLDYLFRVRYPSGVLCPKCQRI